MRAHSSLGAGGRVTGQVGQGGGRQATRQFSDRFSRRGLCPHQSTPGSQVRNHLARRRHTQQRGRRGFVAKEVFAKEKHKESFPLGPTTISPGPGSLNPITFQMPCFGSFWASSSLISLASPAHMPPANLKPVIWFEFLALPLGSDLGKLGGRHRTQFPHV